MGFKDRKFKDERFAKISHKLTNLLKEKKYPQQSGLIFAYISLQSDSRAGYKARVSYDEIVDRFGYSKRNVSSSIKALTNNGFIELVNSGHGGKKAIYRLLDIPENSFERFTNIFINNKRLTTKEKEFLVRICPHILSPFDNITSNYSKIARDICVSKTTVARHMKSLINKGYAWINDDCEDMIRVDLDRIMLESVQDVIEELTTANENFEEVSAEKEAIEKDLEYFKETCQRLDKELTQVKMENNKLKKENDYLIENK